MGKKSRLKKERRERIAAGLEQPISKEQRREEKELRKQQERDAINAGILLNLKAQWKKAAEEQYKTEPEKVRSSNIKKNADDICNNLQIKAIMKMRNIKQEDIARILTEIRDEVIAEAQ